MIYAALTKFKISCNLRVFSTKYVLVFSKSGPGGINSRYDYSQRSTVKKKYFSRLHSPLVLPYPIIIIFLNQLIITKILTTFIKIAQEMDFNRPGFAMAVLQTPFWLTHWLTDSSFSYCVSHVICPLSGVTAFFWSLWYQWSLSLLVVLNDICLLCN